MLLWPTSIHNEFDYYCNHKLERDVLCCVDNLTKISFCYHAWLKAEGQKT